DDLHFQRDGQADGPHALTHARGVAPARLHLARLDAARNAPHHAGHVPEEGPERRGRRGDGDLADHVHPEASTDVPAKSAPAGLRTSSAIIWRYSMRAAASRGRL